MHRRTFAQESALGLPAAQYRYLTLAKIFGRIPVFWRDILVDLPIQSYMEEIIYNHQRTLYASSGFDTVKQSVACLRNLMQLSFE